MHLHLCMLGLTCICMYIRVCILCICMYMLCTCMYIRVCTLCICMYMLCTCMYIRVCILGIDMHMRAEDLLPWELPKALAAKALKALPPTLPRKAPERRPGAPPRRAEVAVAASAARGRRAASPAKVLSLIHI